jgi:SnoaL-like domain
MQRSPDLVAVVRRIYELLTTGDADAFDSLITSTEALTFLGTDPTEWYTDRSLVLDLVRSQAGAGVTARPGDIQAFEEGDAGWASDKGAFVLPDGSEVPFRLTVGCLREGGEWRLVQVHTSIAIANEEVLGVDV